MQFRTRILFIFILALFTSSSFTQQSEQQIIKQYLDGNLEITNRYQKEVVSQYLEQNTVREESVPYIDPSNFDSRAIFLNEAFTGATGTTPPAGWQNVVNAGGNPAQPWEFGVTSIGVTGGGFDVEYAGVNSDAYGSGNTQNTSLITPSINLSASSQVILSFSEQFRFISGSSGTLSISTDGGTNWTTLVTRTATLGHPNPAVQTSMLVPQAANQANVMFRWTYVGTWGWWWAIDNVVVRDAVTPAAPITFNVPTVGASSMTVEWTDNSTDEASFKVYRSTDGVNYTQVGANITSTSVATTGTVYSQVQTGLTASTLYHFRIVSVGDFESSFLTGTQMTTAAGNITSAGSGLWNAPGTWTGGQVPSSGDNVTVANGHTVTINSSSAYSVTVLSGGILEFEADTARTLTVETNVTVNNGGTFQTGATGIIIHTLSLGGNLVNNGTLDFSTNTNTAGAGITFTGPNNSSFTGTGATTDLRSLTLSKTARTVEVELNLSNFSVRGAATAANGTTFALLTSGAGTGTLKISGTNAFDGTLWSVAGYNIPVTMGFWMNNPNFVVNGQNGSPSVAGLFRMTAGTFNIGTSSGNSMGFSTGSVITVEGGAINATGRFGVSTSSNAITYTQTNGTITVQTIGHTSTSLAGFDLGTSTGSTISMSGGNIYIQLASTATSGPRDYRFQSGLGIASVTGGTVQFGNASSTATVQAFDAVGVFPTLIVDNTSAAHTLLIGTVAVYNHISGSIIIDAGCTLNFGTTFFLFAGSSITNNGILTHNGASSRFIFFGTLAPRPANNGDVNNINGAETIASLFVDESSVPEEIINAVYAGFTSPEAIQSITGSGTFTAPMSSFEVQNPDGVSLTPTNNIVVSRIILFDGDVTGSAKLTVGNAAATTGTIQFGNGGAPSLAGGSFDVAPTFNLGTGGQVMVYAQTLTPQTTDNEINPGRVLTTLTATNPDAGYTLTIAGGNLSVGTLNVTAGVINTTSSNLVTVTGTTAGSVTGGSATAWVNGPLERTLPASLVAGSTYNLPVGKGSYKPAALVDAVTTAVGPVVVRAEVFDANSGGTAGTGLLNLNTNRYWNVSATSGGSELTSTKVRLTEDGLTSTMGIGKSATVNGTYNLVSSLAPAGGSVTTDDMASLSFFAIGERVLVDDPTGVSATAVSGTQINVAFTPNGATDDVVIVFNTTGTFSTPTGAPPAVGQPFAGGEVLSNGTTSPVNHTGLTGATTYFYKAFSYDGTDYSIGVAVNASTWGSLPYTQDFESLTFPPSAWSTYGDKLWTAGLEPHGGSRSARISYTPTGTGNLQGPVFVLPASPDYRIKFWWKDDDITIADDPEIIAHDTTYFEVSTNGGTNWTVLSFLSQVEPDDNYSEVTVDLDSYAGETVSFRWRDVSDGTFSAYGTGLDDVLIEVIPASPIFSVTPVSKDFGSILAGNTSTPQDFVITNTGAGTLSVTAGSLTGANANQFTLSTETYPKNLTAGQSDTVTVTFAPTTAGSKTANLQLTHNAAGSPGLVPLTGNGLPVGSLVEDFTGTTFPPAGWLAINNDTGTKTWVRNTGKFNSEPASASSNWESSTITNNDWLISPKVSVSTGDDLTYYHSSNGFDEVLVVKVGLTADPNGVWTTIDSLIDSTPEVWTFESYDLSAFNGQEVYIAFVNRGTDQFTLYIDDVTGPLVAQDPNDIGIASYDQGRPVNQIVPNSELSRGYSEKDPGGSQSISISIKEKNANTESVPMDFDVIVENFGTATQNSYQVGWHIDGVGQTSVSNTQPLEVGDTDTLTLTWATPTSGPHFTRAWTILGTDTNPSNDSSGVINFYVVPENVIFGEYFEDAIPPAGWLTVNNDGGGTVDPWAASPTVFTFLEGSQYIASNFSGANGFLIDDWLISNNTGGLLESGVDDTLSFWVQSPDSPFLDSLQILVSTTDTSLASFSLLAYIEVPKTGWTQFKYALPAASARYIAFRYLMYDGGPSGSNSDYIGLDAVEIIGGGSSSTFNLTVSVANSWNMVSAPGLHPVNQNVTTWWSGKDPAASVFKYSGGYSAVTTTTPGQGYWMKNVGAQTYVHNGVIIVAHDPIAGATGWNLIGPYDYNALTSGITTVPPGQVQGSVFGYAGGYFAEDTLKPGYGYWIKLGTAAQIVLPSSSFKGVSKIVNNIGEDWGKIIITDASGKGYTLYAVNGKADLNMFELPPAPPSGVFDVRYGSGRYAEDINESSQQIEMNGLVYPVTVRAEGIAIRLQDETGRVVNERLKSGEKVTINHSISKLLASKDIIPDKYSLEQNYPNPFNPSTVIEFSIPENAKDVSLTIYNALGEKVAEVVNGSFEAGVYEYQWNAVNLASGLYIYELRTEKFVSVKKMMLLK